ncbi:unnamed protein product [Staurois parvus]|uniref:Uncharacterized protein n=1 Tax=Staurois parvus TaxID=386267 RepID=A0ABN9DFN9_9NEOB|nr:unnamed protein product [Staurois parvus]
MRHCKADSYKSGSQRQRHDGNCNSSTARGPQFDTSVVKLQVPSCLCLWESCL